MKNISVLALSTIIALTCSVAYAAQSGPVIGIQAGVVLLNDSSNMSFTDWLSTFAPITGRVYGGYQFNQYLQAEVGYSPIHNTASPASGFYTDGKQINGPNHYKQNVYDLSAKLRLPVSPDFNVFVSPGIALNSVDSYDKLYKTDREPLINIKKTVIAPKIGVGAELMIHKKFGFDISVNHIFTVKNVTGVSTAMLGVSYRFG